MFTVVIISQDDSVEQLTILSPLFNKGPLAHRQAIPQLCGLLPGVFQLPLCLPCYHPVLMHFLLQHRYLTLQVNLLR